jgi:glycosyltransferase involved in cell wall biosynthesis
MGDRVRVLYLTSSGSLDGGAQIQYRYLIGGLNGSRYEPFVLTPTAGSLHDTLAGAGIQTWTSPYPIWSRGEVLRWRHRLWLERRHARDRLIAFARAHAPHLVHGDVSVAPYLAAISSALAIPAVVHVRGAVKRQEVRRRGLQRAAAIVAIGHHYRDALLDCRVPGERIAVIPDAADLGRFRPRHDAVLRREDRSIAADEVLFGIVGRIEPFKRQLDFLRAAGRVLATGRRARFFVIGAPNPNRPWYVRRVRAFPAAHRIDRHVTLTGPRNDMEQVMASLDVLVTLSGGSVMLEAMACGVPVVTASARHPGSLHLVRDGEGGRVVPAGDPDALVSVLSELCDDADQRRRLGASGRRRAEAHFGCDRLVDETARLYDAVLAAR